MGSCLMGWLDRLAEARFVIVCSLKSEMVQTPDLLCWHRPIKELLFVIRFTAGRHPAVKSLARIGC